MKKFVMLLCSVAVTCIACSEATSVPQAKVTPATTTTYTNAQIDEMISNYHASVATAANPTQETGAKFLTDFPGARDIERDMSNDIYEVDFEISNLDYEAWYDAAGSLIMYKYDISTSAIPTVVKTAVKQKYDGYRIDEAEKIMKGTVIAYKVSVEKGETEIDAFYRADGTFISERIDW